MSSNRHSPSDDVRRIDREAAAWVVARDRGLTAGEQDAYFQWLAADPRHGEWVARHQQTWKEFNLLAEWKPEHSNEPNPDLLARMPSKRSPGRVIRAWFGVLAAAACVALTAAWFLISTEEPSFGPVSTPSVSAIAQAYERRVLEDGSVVELNKGAQIITAFSAGERRVRLIQGEANFTVARNPERPFIVRAGGVNVRAVGTAFNVRLDPQNVHVYVTEGKVRVDDAIKGGTVLATTDSVEDVLTKGQAVTVSAVGAVQPVPVVTLSDAEATRALAWRPELLTFDSEPLSAVVAEFNLRNRVQIEIADPELNSMPFVVRLKSDNIEGLKVQLRAASIDVTHEGDRIVLRKQP